MRLAGWILGGMVVGVIAGAAAGLLRRQPARFDRPAYAGGYAPPTPSSDHTVARPAENVGSPADHA